MFFRSFRCLCCIFFFFFQAEDGIRDLTVTGVQTCALPISVLTNVNADARVLAPAFLAKVAALAAVFRPYGLRVYLTARFSAPIELGGLATADPLDSAVRAWWRGKVDEIYHVVPDFGGFVVKADSEGQPGPDRKSTRLNSSHSPITHAVFC